MHALLACGTNPVKPTGLVPRVSHPAARTCIRHNGFVQGSTARDPVRGYVIFWGRPISFLGLEGGNLQKLWLPKLGQESRLLACRTTCQTPSTLHEHQMWCPCAGLHSCCGCWSSARSLDGPRPGRGVHLLVWRAVTPVMTSWGEDLLRWSCRLTARLAESLMRWMGCTSTSTSGVACARCSAMPCHICQPEPGQVWLGQLEWKAVMEHVVVVACCVAQWQPVGLLLLCPADRQLIERCCRLLTASKLCEGDAGTV